MNGSHFSKLLISASVILIIAIFFAGCITPNSPANTSQQKAPLASTIHTQTIATQSITSGISITTGPDTTKISPTPSPGPVFTETGRPMTDANGTQILSKVQAWSYAEKYLDSNVGLRNIQSFEVIAHDPVIFTDRNKTQELIWFFEIDRKDQLGVDRGGMIAINAYDGHVVFYS